MKESFIISLSFENIGQVSLSIKSSLDYCPVYFVLIYYSLFFEKYIDVKVYGKRPFTFTLSPVDYLKFPCKHFNIDVYVWQSGQSLW